MAKKGRPPPPGVPEWVVTYGDLMSLLLCFFILLAAFSEIKQERAKESMKRASDAENLRQVALQNVAHQQYLKEAKQQEIEAGIP